MDSYVKKFIEENINLIEQNKWEEVYRFAVKELFPTNVGEVTSCLIDADIHPEAYLMELPNSFLYESSIEEFTIPNNVISIGDYAFYKCNNLTSIVIPDSVTSIGGWAFYDCTNLTSVMLGNKIKSIDRGMFEYCYSLIRIDIPNSVTNIGDYAFKCCHNLASVEIPISVTNIGDGAFDHCGDKLVIEYKGTKADWKKIYTSRAFEDTYFTVKCADGMVVKKKR